MITPAGQDGVDPIPKQARGLKLHNARLFGEHLIAMVQQETARQRPEPRLLDRRSALALRFASLADE